MLTHLRPVFPSQKKQLIDLQGKSIDWFLYVMTIDFKDTKEQLQKKEKYQLTHTHKKYIYTESLKDIVNTVEVLELN